MWTHSVKNVAGRSAEEKVGMNKRLSPAPPGKIPFLWKNISLFPSDLEVFPPLGII
jgi:hypothetical protein